MRGFLPIFGNPVTMKVPCFDMDVSGVLKGPTFRPKKPECWRMGNRITIAIFLDFTLQKIVAVYPLGVKDVAEI